MRKKNRKKEKTEKDGKQKKNQKLEHVQTKTLHNMEMGTHGKSVWLRVLDLLRERGI